MLTINEVINLIKIKLEGSVVNKDIKKGYLSFCIPKKNKNKAVGLCVLYNFHYTFYGSNTIILIIELPVVVKSIRTSK